MIKQFFAVLDSKAGIYGNPFISLNTETAIRDFTYATTDPETQISRYPEDFALYLLGSFNDETGEIIHAGVEILVHAKQVLPKGE